MISVTYPFLNFNGDTTILFSYDNDIHSAVYFYQCQTPRWFKWYGTIKMPQPELCKRYDKHAVYI